MLHLRRSTLMPYLLYVATPARYGVGCYDFFHKHCHRHATAPSGNRIVFFTPTLMVASRHDITLRCHAMPAAMSRCHIDCQHYAPRASASHQPCDDAAASGRARAAPRAFAVYKMRASAIASAATRRGYQRCDMARYRRRWRDASRRATPAADSASLRRRRRFRYATCGGGGQCCARSFRVCSYVFFACRLPRRVCRLSAEPLLPRELFTPAAAAMIRRSPGYFAS